MADLFEVLVLMAVPALILLVGGFFNRRWDRLAAINGVDDSLGASVRRQGGAFCCSEPR
jgi:hypothetical protein